MAVPVLADTMGMASIIQRRQGGAGGGSGREQGKRANKASKFPPLGSFCSSRTAKVKIKDKAANKNKTKQ